MILLSALLLAAHPGAEPDDIVVIARRLRAITVSLGRDPAGRTTCGIDRSSGDAALDAAMCRRAVRCLPGRPLPPAKFDACLDRQRTAIAASMRKGERP